MDIFESEKIDIENKEILVYNVRSGNAIKEIKG